MLRKSVAVLFSLFFLLGNESICQQKLPPFQMMQSNYKVFKASNLPYERPIIIIYFSPECDHCQRLMKNFFENVKLFDNVSVAMVSFLSVETMQKFEKDYNVRRYPNIYVGTEGNSFFLRQYYGLTEMPFAATYRKDGNLIASYSKLETVAPLIKDMRSIISKK